MNYRHGISELLYGRDSKTTYCIVKPHKYWMTSYIIMCVMIVVSLPLYSYIYSCSNLTDYKEHINSGDTIIIPIHGQYLVTSLTVSVDSSCQGTLYLVPANEMTSRYRNREISYTFKDAFLTETGRRTRCSRTSELCGFSNSQITAVHKQHKHTLCIQPLPAKFPRQM